MSKGFAGIVEMGFLPSDDAETRLKKTALTLVPLIIGPAAFIWGMIYFWLGHPLSGSIPMSYSVISAFSLLYFSRTKHTTFIQYSQLTLVLLLPFLLMWSLGGFAAGSMVMIWAIFAPIAAVMFLPKRQALVWFGLFFLLIVISVLLEDYLSATVKPLPDLARDIFYLLNLGFGSAGLYLLVSYALNEEKRSNKADLRIAASAFEAQEGLMITNAEGIIQRINQAFSKASGYLADDVVGHKPSILKSDRHDTQFYQQLWESVLDKGFWQGEIWNRRKSGEVYPEWLTISAVRGDDNSITHFVSSHLDITERKASEEKILKLAFYDTLTELPNRQLLIDRINKAQQLGMRNGQFNGLLFLDLDNFKTINDSMGHNVGDSLLQHVAKRLLASVRTSDTVARLGGDEFVVMVQAIGDDEHCAAEHTELIGNKILDSLRQEYRLDMHIVRSSTSIGATLFGKEPISADDILKQADIAMYQSKKSGRNALRFYDPAMQVRINERAKLEGALYQALQQSQFKLYYQIQVDEKRNVIGAEALLRWKHPEFGMVSPADFIPLAEETGLIRPIGKWVLETACKQLKIWSQAESTRNLVLAVNISANQFHQPEFASQVDAIIQAHGISPNRLKLELTESLLLEDTEEAISMMSRLKLIGLQISLDDFGTGYSSLKYLKLLPLNQIKIDKSFVNDITTDPNDAAIVQTIIAMSKSLGLQVIAEGVETEAQREFLLNSGCSTYQGYLFGRPVPIEQLNLP